MSFIYALADPRNSNHIRYVGMAMQPKRPYEHIKVARKGVKSHCYNWIRLLLADGIEPIITILEQCSECSIQKEVGEREKFYVKQLHAMGHELTNATGGGWGGPPSIESRAKISTARKGIKFSLETRKKMSKAAKKRPRQPFSNKTRMKISIALTGRHYSPERCAEMSRVRNGRSHHSTKQLAMLRVKGRKHSAESRTKISVAKKGQHQSPEHRMNNSEAHKGLHHLPESYAKQSATMKNKTEAEKETLTDAKTDRSKL